MPDSASAQQVTVKQVQTIHGVMLAAVFLYAFAAERIRPSGSANPPDELLLIVFGALAAFVILLALFMRKRSVSPAVERLQMQPDDPDALKRWRAGCIQSSVFFESCALDGLALRFQGYSLAQCLPFYLAACVLMLLFWPRLD